MMYVKVLALIGDMDGPALWRVLLPFSELQRQGYQGVDWDYWDNSLLGNIVHLYDAVILPRKFWPPEERDKARNWFRAVHNAGIAVIYEMDDDMISDDFVRRIMYKDGYGKQYARRRRKWIIESIKACDGVTVSCQRLATMVRTITDKPVCVVPNFIDLNWFNQIQAMNERQIDGLTIGWAGGARPDKDVENMAIAWGRIAQKHPDINFIIQGHQPSILYENVPDERIKAVEWMGIDGYPAGMLNIDIGCCPLADTKFNRAKTYIKALEYAASGSPIVASSTVYSQVIEHGVDGFIANNADEWELYLTALIENADLRQRISDALMEKITHEHALETQAWRWMIAWTDIVEKFHQRREILLPVGAHYADTE